MNRLNILVVAHEFSPTQGSECAVGWNIVNNLIEFHDVTVLYAKTNQFGSSNYEKSVLNCKIPDGLTVIPIEQPKITKVISKFNHFLSSKKSSIGFAPLYYLGYRYWQKSAYLKAKELTKSNSFHIVHQLTSISYREPGFLWKLPCHFVWGPCSGLVKLPKRFYKHLTFKERSFEFLRTLSNYLQSNFSFRVKKAIKKAKLIYVVTKDDFNYFSLNSSGKLFQMLDVGTYEENVRDSIPFSTNRKLQIVWVGRIVYTKALDILIEAIVKDATLYENTTLKIVGDGPLSLLYQERYKKYTNIQWIGNLPHDRVFKILNESDVLVHTSIKEATSAVILEALSFGLPVICHDAFGASYAIDETCGIKVPLHDRNESIQGFSSAIKRLSIDRRMLNNLKMGALSRSTQLRWSSMAQRIANDYFSIIDSEP